MENGKSAEEMFSQGAGKAVEGLGVWADANQRLLQQLAEFTATAAKESVRLYTELQQATVEAMRDAQATALRWQTTWQEAPKDPMAWYQRAVTDSVDGAQRAFRLLEGSAQAWTRSAERLQSTAEQAGKSIQETFSTAVTKMKEVYAG